MKLYTKNDKIIDVEITLEDILEVIYYNEDFVKQLIKENPDNYKYGLSFNEYLFLCLDLENPKILNEHEENFYNFYYKFSKEIEYIEYISILSEKGIGNKLPDFEINHKLLKTLNCNMNPNYTTEEKLIYYYFKLCFLLNIDTLYNFACIVFGEKGFYNFKKSANRLETINDINNNVACFEFTAIFDKLIKKSNEYAANWEYTGDRQHINTEAVIAGKLYKFDALEDPHGRNKTYRDILNVKLNRGYDGIVAGVDDFIQGINSHFPYIDKIYIDVQKEFSNYLKQHKFSEETLLNCLANIEKLNIDNDTKTLLKQCFIKFNACPLKGVEFYIEILSLFEYIINETKNSNIKLTGVGSTIDGYDFKLLLSVITQNDDYIYFLFGKDNIEILNKEKIIELLERKSIIITQSKNKIIDKTGITNYQIKYRTIPGIDEDFQALMNKEAEEEVLWPMLQETYESSLNIKDKDKNKKLVKTINN